MMVHELMLLIYKQKRCKRLIQKSVFSLSIILRSVVRVHPHH